MTSTSKTKVCHEIPTNYTFSELVDYNITIQPSGSGSGSTWLVYAYEFSNDYHIGNGNLMINKSLIGPPGDTIIRVDDALDEYYPRDYTTSFTHTKE